MKKAFESKDGNCPYCLSSYCNSKGGKYGKRFFICMECNKSFTHGSYKKDFYISLNVTKACIDFTAEIIEAANFCENDFVQFDIINDNIFINKKETGLKLRRKDNISKTLRTQEQLATYFLRSEFGIEKASPFILEYNPVNNSIMGIIKKNDIRKVATHDRIAYDAKSFIAVRKSGLCYISAKLAYELKILRGEYLTLYKQRDKNYLFIANTIEEKEAGFRINRTGSEGFTNSLAVNQLGLAIFLCDLFKMDKGASFRVKCSNPIVVDGKKMVQLETII